MRNYLFTVGTTVALLNLFVLGGCTLSEQQLITKTKHAETGMKSLKRDLPSLSTLLELRNNLILTEKQLKALNFLKSQEDLELRPIETELSSVQTKFERTAQPSELHINLRDMQKAADESFGANKRKEEIVRRYSKRAWQILSIEQQNLAHEQFFGVTKKHRRVLSFPLRGAAHKIPAQF